MVHFWQAAFNVRPASQDAGFFMPKSPPKPCKHAGCGVLVLDGSGFCKPHARAVEVNRGSAHERGYTGAWRKARLHWLRAHPLCAACEARSLVVAASVVDHVTPHRGNKTLFWDSQNWQSMCKPCHDRKTVTQDGGWGKSPKPSVA